MFCGLQRFFLRFKYPIILPEEVARTLEINAPINLTVDELIVCLTSGSQSSPLLVSHAKRETLEKCFSNAQQLEKFGRKTLISYYFSEGWLELSLEFDAHDTLSRAFVIHQKIPGDQGYEIALNNQNSIFSLNKLHHDPSTTKIS